MNPYYTLVLLVASVVSAALAGYVWRVFGRRRGVMGAGEIVLLLVALAVWSGGYALEFWVAGLGAKVFWAKVQYIGIVTVPVAWLAFGLRYSGNGRWVTRRNVALLAVPSLVALALVWTNEAHALIWSHTALGESGGNLLLEHGLAFWAFWGYSQILVVFGAILLLFWTLFRSSRLYRRQGAALLLALAAPGIGNVLYVLGASPDLDLTPFAFLVSGAAVSLGLFRYGFLEIVPVARYAVVEGMNDLVVVTDSAGRIVDVNPTARGVLGLVPEAVGSPLAEIAPELYALLNGGSRQEISLGAEAERREYEMALSTLRDRKGGPTGRLLVLRDVTERKKTERELVRQRAELAQSNAELEQFAYLIAHDLRAPLRSMNGFSQILIEDYATRLDNEGREHLERVENASRRMGRMIDELLELSRLTRIPLLRESVNLTALAENIIADLRRSEPERRVEVAIEVGMTTEGDPRLLKVALKNLLGNAWKFTSRNPAARIELVSNEVDGERIYRLRDNGVGFDMAYADKLFGVFQRLHATDEFEGVGIGLAAARRVIERHGGRVRAEGTVDEEAMFYFTL